MGNLAQPCVQGAEVAEHHRRLVAKLPGITRWILSSATGFAKDFKELLSS
jgi:hypothetical protein